jgi:CSLREA domain-containing protein
MGSHPARSAVVSLLAGAALAAVALAPPAGAATISPTTTNDDFTTNGNCSLREAVQAANTNLARDACPAGSSSQPDTIALPGAFYLLNLGAAGENFNASGDLDVLPATNSPLTIKSNGSESEINGNLDDRVIDDSSAGALTLDHITLNAGDPPSGDGGGLRNTGTGPVTLLTSSVTHSHTTARGGGLRVGLGDLTLSHSTVSNNESTASSGVAVGGGISSGGNLTIDSSVVSSNQVDPGGNGITEDVRGGGISAQAGTITLTDSGIVGNSVTVGETDTAGAGGIFAQGVQVTITGSTLSSNSVSDLGSSVAGGLFFTDTGATKHLLRIQNSTFAANSAQSQGGALQVFDGLSAVRSSTFFANTSNFGEAIVFDDFADPISQLRVGSTLIDDPVAATECAGPDLPDTDGFNIERGTTCGLTGTGDLQNTNGNLLGLALNGGPTPTNALPGFPGSPAIDRIPLASCTQIDTTPLTTDQRGAPRGFDEDADGIAECDVGAYELNRCLGGIVNVLGANGINGTLGADVILGSPGFDAIDPLGGDDKVCAGGGDDNVVERPGGGSDAVDGGSGSDTLALGNGTGSPAGTIDLAAGHASIPSGTGTAVDLTSIENASGSVQGDTLTGDGGPNTLDGGIGDDTITGGGGVDTLLGGDDNDHLFARDGIGDTVDCGPGTADSAQTDRLTLDLVSGCETLDALAEPQVQQSPTPAPPAAATPGAGTTKKCKKKRKRAAVTAKKCKKKRR